MSSSKSIKNVAVMFGLVAALLAMKVTNFAVAHYGILLDKKCGVYYNHTQFFNSENEMLSERTETFRTCFNDTLYNMGSNVSKFEQWDCQSRCYQILYGHANNDGSFNPKFSDLIEERYKKYSNASTSYIHTIASVYEECATEASKKLKLLQANGTATGECMINGLYEDCYYEQFLQKSKTNTTEVCGTKLKT